MEFCPSYCKNLTTHLQQPRRKTTQYNACA